MPHSDWLSYYKAIGYSLLVAKSNGFESNCGQISFCLALTSETSLIYWPIRARGIIVKSIFVKLPGKGGHLLTIQNRSVALNE